MAKPKGGKKRKAELVFDAQKRRDFLTGFRKRKQERREKAKVELEKQVKDERKRIKQELRDGFQEQFKKSFAPIELEGKLKEEEYDAEDVTVQIVELSPDDIAKSNNWIGSNKPIYEKDQASDVDEQSSEPEEEGSVPGFGSVISSKSTKKMDIQDDNANDENGEDVKKKKKFKDDFKSKRAMGQYLAKQAQNSLKHSKAFQMKNKLEKIRNKKKARIEKEKRIKLQNKREKHKKNSTKPQKPSKFNKKGKTKKNQKIEK